MKKTIIFALTLVATVVLAIQCGAAQETKSAASDKAAAGKNPVLTAVKEVMERQQKNITAAVDEMPADKFGFKPTPEQMTFGHLVIHIALSNIELCSKTANMPPPPIGQSPQESDKSRLQALLAKSFLYCNSAISHEDDSKLGDSIEIFGGQQVTRAYALIALTNDWADHYGAASVYLRLNGLLPPTAQGKK